MPVPNDAVPTPGFASARRFMVDGQVRPSDVTDLRVIDAMLAVPREAFVPAAQRGMAYIDLDLEIGTSGRFLIKPVVVARLLQAADIKPTDRVLVVGCATGYVAAVVAHLATEVVATEPDPALAAQAAATLAAQGYAQVTVVQAPAEAGDPTHAPYDVIVLDGATAVEPTRLYQQLAEDGCLVGVFGIRGPQRAVLVRRSHDGFGERALFDASAPVLPGLQQTPEFVF